MNGYGKILMELRGEKPREKVAKEIGISPSALGMYEIELRIPRDDIKIKLANYFHKSVQEIFFAEQCHDMRQTAERSRMKEMTGTSEELK